VTERPEPREINSWQAAEANGAAWMRFWGFPDARVTESGSDGGIDIRATGAFAQVKREAKPVGRPAIQRLVGARGIDVSRHLLFFSLSGYSQAAFDYAAQMGIALFQYSSVGMMTGVNYKARRIIADAREPVPTIEAPDTPSKIVPLWDPDEVDEFYFGADYYTVLRAISKMHEMGSETANEKAPVDKGNKKTIAPVWLNEYAGLVSITADVKPVSRGKERVVRVRWSSYSNGTPETMERVTNDAAEGLERAHAILVQLIGPPVAKPRKSKS
jgi:hypothetical protein